MNFFSKTLTSIKEALSRNVFLISLMLGLVFLSYLIPVLMDGATLRDLVREDGPVESLGAALFLAGAIFIFYSLLRPPIGGSVHGNPWKFWMIGLGLLFFVACGEEISWGQRIFNFETPEALLEVNKQKEFNLHNFEPFHGLDDQGERKTGLAAWLTIHRIFYSVMFGFFVFLPLVMVANNRLTGLIRATEIPIAPLDLSVLYVFVLAGVKVFQRAFAHENDELYHNLVEIMETNIALVTCLYGISLNRKGPFIA